MSDVKLSDLLTTRAYKALERAGITTLSEFGKAIETFGIADLESGFYFGRGGPYLRMVGPVISEEYQRMLDAQGFDYGQFVLSSRYLSGPKTPLEYRLAIDTQIKRLIELLDEYRLVGSAQQRLPPDRATAAQIEGSGDTRPAGEA